MLDLLCLSTYMRGRAISPCCSLLWGIIFYESEALATRHTQQPVVCVS